ncbi:MAG TPA: hypothetical protein VK738_21340 [Terriglobales bacterium]|nr:hypothetical protein [Terriglobales bacterium]
MASDKIELQRIFDRTDGHCHICWKKLCFNNYGDFGSRGCWEVEHSIARANGGTCHGNNKYAACISCNRSKGTNSSRLARLLNGRTRAPLSRSKKEKIRKDNTVGGSFLGGLAGAFLGPGGILLGAILGGVIGNSIKPEAK